MAVRTATMLLVVGLAGCALDRHGVGAASPEPDGSPPPRLDGGRDADVGPPADSGPPDARVRDSGRSDADVGAPRCTSGEARCAEDSMQRCVGGSWEPESACLLGCADSTRCRQLVPAHVSADLFDPRAASFDVDAPRVVDTEGCIGGRVEPQLAGGASVCVLPVGSFRVRAGVLLRIVGNRGLVILAAGDVALEPGSTIDASAIGVNPGAGGSPPGFGLAAGSSGLESGGSDGGGGGGGLCGNGGDGGAGLDEAAPGGQGGVAFGAFPRDLVGGSGGGGGGRDGRAVAAQGGAGGGAVQISAQGTMRLGGRILAGGGGGAGGAGWDTTDAGSGGGGGSGGMIFLEAAVMIDEGVYLGAGGGGGGGSASSGQGNGGPAYDGEALMGGRPVAGGSSGGDTWGARGGDSGAGGMLDGQPGADGGGNGAGGGGGAGCIGLRTATGVEPPGPGIVSPGAGIAFFTGMIETR